MNDLNNDEEINMLLAAEISEKALPGATGGGRGRADRSRHEHAREGAVHSLSVAGLRTDAVLLR